jgi:hypothetical protein
MMEIFIQIDYQSLNPKHCTLVFPGEQEQTSLAIAKDVKPIFSNFK